MPDNTKVVRVEGRNVRVPADATPNEIDQLAGDAEAAARPPGWERRTGKELGGEAYHPNWLQGEMDRGLVEKVMKMAGGAAQKAAPWAAGGVGAAGPWGPVAGPAAFAATKQLVDPEHAFGTSTPGVEGDPLTTMAEAASLGLSPVLRGATGVLRPAARLAGAAAGGWLGHEWGKKLGHPYLGAGLGLAGGMKALDMVTASRTAGFAGMSGEALPSGTGVAWSKLPLAGKTLSNLLPEWFPAAAKAAKPSPLGSAQGMTGTAPGEAAGGTAGTALPLPGEGPLTSTMPPGMPEPQMRGVSPKIRDDRELSSVVAAQKGGNVPKPGAPGDLPSVMPEPAGDPMKGQWSTERPKLPGLAQEGHNVLDVVQGLGGRPILTPRSTVGYPGAGRPPRPDVGFEGLYGKPAASPQAGPSPTVAPTSPAGPSQEAVDAMASQHQMTEEEARAMLAQRAQVQSLLRSKVPPPPSGGVRKVGQ